MRIHAITLGFILALATIPTASALLTNRSGGNCGAPGGGYRFTGVYDDDYPNVAFVEAGGYAWCTPTGSGDGLLVLIESPHGGVSAWWFGTSAGSCTVGYDLNVPDHNIARNSVCPLGLAPPDPGWGSIPLL